jgi:hypothetical protein
MVENAFRTVAVVVVALLGHPVEAWQSQWGAWTEILIQIQVTANESHP